MKEPIHLPSAGIGALLSVALLALTSGRQPRQESAEPQAWEYRILQESASDLFSFSDPKGFAAIRNGFRDMWGMGWEHEEILCPEGATAALIIWKRPKKAK